MIKSTLPTSESELESSYAKRLESRGYSVILSPQREQMPFDLGGFSPDLVAYGTGDDNLVVEVLGKPQSSSVERLQTIAEKVSSQPGWRFVVVSPEDVSDLDQSELLTADEIRERVKSAARSKGLVDDSSQFLYLWPALEALLRRLAAEANIPVENRPATGVIEYLYSFGVISRPQFQLLKSLLDVRNRLVHGFRSESAAYANSSVVELTNELLAQLELEYA